MQLQHHDAMTALINGRSVMLCSALMLAEELDQQTTAGECNATVVMYRDIALSSHEIGACAFQSCRRLTAGNVPWYGKASLAYLV